jgi:hypothetical protein
MVKLDTRIYKSIEVEIDGTIHKLKKVTNRVMLRGIEISEQIQKDGVSMAEVVDLTAEFLMLYLPLEKDWILDNLSMDECRCLMDGITGELTKALEGSEPPLASGPGGDSLPK